jgi:hypothetical protein
LTRRRGEGTAALQAEARGAAVSRLPMRGRDAGRPGAAVSPERGPGPVGGSPRRASSASWPTVPALRSRSWSGRRPRRVSALSAIALVAPPCRERVPTAARPARSATDRARDRAGRPGTGRASAGPRRPPWAPAQACTRGAQQREAMQEHNWLWPAPIRRALLRLRSPATLAGRTGTPTVDRG